MKAFREKVNKTVLRDWTLAEVGDCLVSDGHTVEVMLIDPRDGKEKKFQILGWIDAASRMPVGFHINLTENTESIQLSFRNAILFTRWLPRVAYTDNGKAYKSKYMSGSMKSGEEIEIELQGLFGRLGVETIHSLPYNAKAKVIERMWLSMQEELERFMSGWTGSNALAKPVTMKRDEKFIRRTFRRRALTVDEFKAFVEYWAINIYGQGEHPDNPGKTRLEVFHEGSARVAAERRISPEDLNWMLLAIERKRVTNQGITINKATYWHEALVQYVGRDLIVRTDYWDVRSILVYDERDAFICQAPLRRLQDPLVKLRDDDTSRRALDRELAEIGRVEKRARAAANEQLKRVSDATVGMYEGLPAETRTAMLETAPLIPELKPERTLTELQAAISTKEEGISDRARNDGTAQSTNDTNIREEESEDRQYARALAEMMGISKRRIDKE